MLSRLSEKIEAIRRQPEHIRMRYVIVCLTVSMAFIFGIWTLTLRDSFRSVAQDVPQAAEQGKALLPPKGETPSLSDLLKEAAPLRVENGEKTGQDFFQEQLQDKNNNQENISDTQK